MGSGSNRPIPTFDDVMNEKPKKIIPSFDEVMMEEPTPKKKVEATSLGGVGGGVDMGLQSKSSGTKWKEQILPKIDEKEYEQDPVGSVYKYVTAQLPDIKRIEKPLSSSTSVSPRTLLPDSREVQETTLKETRAPEKVHDLSFKGIKEVIKNTRDNYLNDTRQALPHLMKVTGLSVEELYDDKNDEVVRAQLRKGNMTDDFAYSRLKEARDSHAAIKSGGTIEDMAVTYASRKSPEVAKQIELLQAGGMSSPGIGELLQGQSPEVLKKSPKDAFGESTIGKYMFDFLNNSATFQEMQGSPELVSKFRTETGQLIDKYPSFGKMLLGNIISQKMEDMGMNNSILNVVTKPEADRVVDQLVKDGQFTEKEAEFYRREIRPRMGLENFGRQIIGKPSVRTTGLVENTLEGGTTGVINLGKGAYEAIPGLRESIVGEQEMLRKDIEAQNRYVGVKPKNLAHEITTSGGQMLGQSLSIGGTGGLFKTLTQAKSFTTPVAFAGGLQAYANYAPEARIKFPGEPVKQRGYATLLSTAEALTENIFKDRKVVEGLMGKIKPDVVNTIRDFTAKKITKEAAENILQKSIQTGLKGVKLGGKAVAENTLEEISMEVASQLADGVFENKPVSKWIDGEELWNTTRQAFLGSLFLGGLSARADLQRNKGVTAKTIYDMAQNVDYWTDQINETAKQDEQLAKEALDKIQNLQYAAKVLQDLEGTDMTDKQKTKFLITALDTKIKEEQASKKTDPFLQKKDKEAIKENEAIQEALITGKDDGTIEGDKSDKVYSKEEKLFEELEKKADEGYGFVIQAAKEQGNILGAIDYFEDKFAENPVKFMEDFGDELTDKVAERTSTDKLSKALDYLLDRNPEDPAVSILDKLISEREQGKPEQISDPIELDTNLPEGYQLPEQQTAEAEVNIPQLPTNEIQTEQPIPESTQQTQASETGIPPESVVPPTEEEGAIPPGEPPTGAAIISDDAEQGLSGIRKALVSEEIIKGVNLDRVGDKEMMALGRRIIDTGEVNPRALVEKIVAEKSGVLTPAQVVSMITYKADIDNKLRDLYKEANRRTLQGEERGTIDIEIKDLEDEITDFDIAAVITANQQSMSFRLRQYMLDRDYNLTTQIEKYKKNNNGEIPAEIEEKFKQLDKELKEVKAKLAEAQKVADEKEGQQSVDNISESVKREQQRTEQPEVKKNLADIAIEALEKIQKKIRGKSYSDVSGMVAIVDAGITTIKNAIKAGVAIVDAVELGVSKIKDLLAKKGIKTWEKENEFRKDMLEGFEAEGISTKKSKDAPTINEDGTVSIPNQLLRDLVADGNNTIEKLTDAVHDIVKENLPNVTKRQVRDYITQYGKQVNQNSDEIQQQLNTAKRVGRLLSELEDLQNKKKKQKGTVSKKLTDREIELKRQIKALMRDFPLTEQEKKQSEEKRLEAAKKRAKDKIKELQERIKNKDFAKKEKKLPVVDEEISRLNAQKEKLQEQFDLEQQKIELQNRTFGKKVEDALLELTNGLVRGFVASFDLSATFVQGLWRLFSDPLKSKRAMGTMFKHLVSKQASEDYLTKIKAQPFYPLLKASKLAIDDKSGKVSVKEGLFISNWINWLWDNIVANVLSVGVGGIRDFVRRVNPYSASQRAFDGYVNSIRVQSFLQLAKSLEKQGYNFESDPEVFQKAADFVNTTTGRGSLGTADLNSRWLNIFFFAPRKVISEMKLYSPYAFVYYARMPKSVRKKALSSFGTFALNFLLVNGLIWAARKDWDDDDEEDNFWNPTSTDFLTHKVGDKRVSIAGGMKSILVFQSRFWSGRYTDQYGKETKLGERYGKPVNTRFDLAVRFLTGKASPAVAAAIKVADQRKGYALEGEDVLKDLTIPIFLQDLGELYKDSPAEASAILTLLAIFGANTRTVEEKKKK